MRMLLLILASLSLSHLAAAQQTISFPTEDGGLIYADLYGSGARGLVLAHGGRFNKESWKPEAEQFDAAGFRVLAIDFRGYGSSHGPEDHDFDHAPFQLDVLAAVRYLRNSGAKSVSVVGGSFGGTAAGDASIAARPGEIEKVVMLGGAPSGLAEKLQSASLFLVARDDANDDGPRLPGIMAKFAKAPEPKKLIVVDGAAHAQFLFQTDQAAKVMREILSFLNGKLPK
jgi:pimeloyl-ACP methyl ester carboxylesterase